MTQSPEYPDLLFMPPRAYGTGRDGKAVRYIVVHYTAGSERSSSPLNGARNDQNRMDGTSTHYFVGSGLDNQAAVIQCVLTKNRGNAARMKGNRLGIQYELCGTAQTRAQWLDEASDRTLTNAARQMARDCKKYKIPVRRLTVPQTRGDWYNFPSGPMGFVGHIDCTLAYPEDGGDHTDPGVNFPWDILLSRVQKFLDEGDDEMASELDSKTIDALATATGKATASALVGTDLGKAGGGDTVGRVFQSLLTSNEQIINLLTDIKDALVPPTPPTV